MSGAPGNSFASFNPTPPERGSFPLDHDHECSSIMTEYLECMKLVRGNNALNCRLLAKKYLGCRMDNQLMEKDEWKNLGLPNDDQPREAATSTETQPASSTDRS
ncbi:Cox19p CYBJADRAFT_147103 [Cyberlindnera jadinii NRRL Y-1542]|uniref:Cytochrome c oxidase assembly protein COX19 n=1 Tax=Cyberlindnera jadinii (strain ATCC 18201 / CBS 1600 / BCRC 20928 / JCM 3617 / NBRC 0987 / NRRL Y-1542) TaxID=983966 RepID=A0A1E4S6S1_CYBJN|nr:hypothetical protein CYBJADRAFT_147103 [Cyberlindnera jadinii NRRL Y-1542]ODV75199.1 hypothetical protein CYBJADRAFT_147103 [Cyberlindnera jadinii NRRL Y-1542]